MRNKSIYTPDQIYNIILNSKVSGEKYTMKELEQTDILDIKKLVNPLNWRRDIDGNTIRWSDVMEVHVSSSEKDKVFFKYDFDEAYSELNKLLIKKIETLPFSLFLSEFNTKKNSYDEKKYIYYSWQFGHYSNKRKF
ncbi:hypothetical protein PYW08_006467 [Mythimna loreyi]|uniref:Uncharacterized protein n=1 Tax=Mythimna loreyi TaxID=667449 RepID=A0ACC2QMN7_9NEOP|nr:hypothetical protein PYW08_006467 [Mythimna loreyi]